MKIFAFGILLFVYVLIEVDSRDVQVPRSLNSARYIWFPKDDSKGTIIPAYIGGSPPTKADERDVHFYLFTPTNPSNAQELFNGDLSGLDSSNFNPNSPIKFVSHGFGGSCFDGSCMIIKDGYVDAFSNINVIGIDWKKLAAAPWYDTAAANTRLVGQVTARFIEFLVDNRRATLQQIELVGFSLGGHVVGFIGSGLLVGKPHRIVALDPALPLFGSVSDEGRIDPSDGLFVQVIHTSGGPITSGELAFMDPRGHADFYPNGGRDQPGCTGLPEVVGACSHPRAYEYFVESMKSNRFTSCKCSSWSNFDTCNCGVTAKMGHSAAATLHGYYHLTTNSEPPFAKG